MLNDEIEELKGQIEYWQNKCEEYKLCLNAEDYILYWRLNDHKTYIKSLKSWLASHEGDIANSVNDFADLRNVFIAVFGRQPENN